MGQENRLRKFLLHPFSSRTISIIASNQIQMDQYSNFYHHFWEFWNFYAALSHFAIGWHKCQIFHQLNYALLNCWDFSFVVLTDIVILTFAEEFARGQSSSVSPRGGYGSSASTPHSSNGGGSYNNGNTSGGGGVTPSGSISTGSYNGFSSNLGSPTATGSIFTSSSRE